MLTEEERRVFGALWAVARRLARGRGLAAYFELSDLERKFWEAADSCEPDAPARLLGLAREVASRARELGCVEWARASLVIEAAAAYLQAKAEAGEGRDPLDLLRQYV